MSKIYHKKKSSHKTHPALCIRLFFAVKQTQGSVVADCTVSSVSEASFTRHVAIIPGESGYARLRLSRPRAASSYSVRTASLQLTSQLRQECVYVPEVGVATRKFLAALCVPVAQNPLSKFLNPPLLWGGL